MDHSHHHHDHHHGPPPDGRLSAAFAWGIGLNLVFVVVEVAAGFYTGSLALLTDAGHNLSDVGSLILALFAFRLAQKQPTRAFSYGYRKFTIWASLINGLILLVAVGSIGYEAVHRLSEPLDIPGLTVAWVAGIGIVVNTASAWLFHRDKDNDLNIKGAYLHLAADAAVSAGVVMAGLLIQWTGWKWIDPIVSFLVIAVIIWSTWGLLRESFRLALDGVPPQVNPESIRTAGLKIKGVIDVHHLHIWAMSTMENAMTAHLVLTDGLSPERVSHIKKDFRHALEHLKIHHATLETEFESEDCRDIDCH
ncbi:MAG: cation transporter [Bacteroidetes bacterium]|nr:MAG: cation transporter [Bacteroidota bacterium]